MEQRRSVWALLVAWAALCAAFHLARPAGSWYFFQDGTALLFGGGPNGGLHLYAANPYLQIGPVSFVVAKLLVLVPGTPGVWIAVLAMQSLGLLVLRIIAALDGARYIANPGRLLAAGLVFLPLWAEVSVRSAHLDDVLALTFGVLALLATVRHRPVLAGVLVAAAADSKPWAIGFVAMLFFLPRRTWLAAFGSSVVVVAAAWLPFVVADHGTISAFRYQIHNATASALRALGVESAKTPAWCRTAQMIGGFGAATLIARRAPAAVIFVVVAIRLLLDPSVHTYYTAGLVTGTVLVDVLVLSTLVPWLSATAIMVLYLPQALPFPTTVFDLHLEGVLRAAWLLLAVVVVMVRAMQGGRTPVDRSTLLRSRSLHLSSTS